VEVVFYSNDEGRGELGIEFRVDLCLSESTRRHVGLYTPFEWSGAHLTHVAHVLGAGVVQTCFCSHADHPDRSPGPLPGRNFGYTHVRNLCYLVALLPRSIKNPNIPVPTRLISSVIVYSVREYIAYRMRTC
jgi:hypothetical protein